ncbi:MAG: hypothetical protein NC299_11650 [Lachnospiraceae bacterium]|nr:hypothetical protein [Ruminococcus sp.]MCM1275996.1 hypothetical protein [Lachnospiraceae bacterium]
MNKIEIRNTVLGITFVLGAVEVVIDSGGFFEQGTYGSRRTADPEFEKRYPPPKYPEPLLAGQTELERKLRCIGETSADLWHYDGRDWHYDGFPNDDGLDEFLSAADEAFDELRELLRGEYEVVLDCRMEREYWTSGKERKLERKKRVKLMFDYGTWCLWLYDEYDDFVRPFELSDLVDGQEELTEKIHRLENGYMEQFINNEIEFSYKGFDSRQHAEEFVGLLNDVWNGLNEVLGGEYKLTLAESLDLESWYGGGREGGSE